MRILGICSLGACFVNPGLTAGSDYGFSGGRGFLRGRPRGRFTGTTPSAAWLAVAIPVPASAAFLAKSAARIFLAFSSMRFFAKSAEEMISALRMAPFAPKAPRMTRPEAGIFGAS